MGAAALLIWRRPGLLLTICPGLDDVEGVVPSRSPNGGLHLLVLRGHGDLFLRPVGWHPGRDPMFCSRREGQDRHGVTNSRDQMMARWARMPCSLVGTEADVARCFRIQGGAGWRWRPMDRADVGAGHR